MKYFSVAVVGLMTLASSYAFGSPVGKNAKLYKSGNGEKITIIQLVDQSQNDFLLMVTGTDSKIDQLALLSHKEDQGKETAFYTFINDEKYYLLTFAENHWGGKHVTMRLPEAPTKPINLVFHDKDSQKLDPNSLVKKHEEQNKNGSLRAILVSQDSNWKGHVNRVFKRAVDDAESYCGDGIGAKIDWDSVDSKLIGKIPLATMCRRPADLLGRICQSSGEKKLASKISGITCMVDRSQGLSISADKRLIWKVPADGSVDLGALEKKLRSMIN